MGNFSERQKYKERESEKEKVRIENLGKFFYDLAKLTFVTVVLGNIISFYNDVDNLARWIQLLAGFFFTIILGICANKIFKL